MKMIIALLVMVAVSAATSYQWWDFGDLSTNMSSTSAYWVIFYTDSVTYVGSVYVYALSETSLQNGHVGISQLAGQFPTDNVPMTGEPEWVPELECWRGRFDLDIDTSAYSSAGFFMIYGYTPGAYNESTRITQTLEDSHTFLSSGELEGWEANIIIYDDPVSLQRDTWASIKTSF